MRKKMVAGNWKMNKNLHESILLADDIRQAVETLSADRLPAVVLAPAFPFLYPVSQTLRANSQLAVAAQYCHAARSGAFTGEVSVEMIRSTGARYVIIGHSERRMLFGEKEEEINKKIKMVLEAGLHPVLCVGEKLEERKENRHFDAVAHQLNSALENCSPADLQHLIVAYEPVWAIGTGLTASAAQAQEMHVFIRQTIKQKTDDAFANQLMVLYGGSCNPSNAAELFACPDVDGGLIGGASLNAADFVSIIKAAMK